MDLVVPFLHICQFRQLTHAVLAADCNAHLEVASDEELTSHICGIVKVVAKRYCLVVYSVYGRKSRSGVAAMRC
jgi:hypothetical protein